MQTEKHLIEVPKEASRAYLIMETDDDFVFCLIKGEESKLTEIMFGYGWIASALKQMKEKGGSEAAASQFMLNSFSGIPAEKAFELLVLGRESARKNFGLEI